MADKKEVTFERYADGKWAEVDARSISTGNRVRQKDSPSYMEFNVEKFIASEDEEGLPKMQLSVIHPAYWKGPASATKETTRRKNEQSNKV